MATTTHENVTTHQGAREIDTRDHGTETRRASKTTELIAYAAAVLAVVVTAFVVGDDGANTADPGVSISFGTPGKSLASSGRSATVR